MKFAICSFCTPGQANEHLENHRLCSGWWYSGPPGRALRERTFCQCDCEWAVKARIYNEPISEAQHEAAEEDYHHRA